MTNKQTKKTIPEFKTIQEEAEFWDTHSVSDYWKEAKPVYVYKKPRVMETLPIRFEHDDLAVIRKQANDFGVGTGTLIRMWVKERLRANAAA